MYKIIINFFFVIFIASTVSASTKIKIKVGVTGSFPIAKKYQSSKKYELHFMRDTFDSRLVNKLISGEIDVAVLPAEYALKVFWYRDGFDIIGKAGKCYNYLITPIKMNFSGEKSLKRKKIMLVKNSGSEYFLNKYLGNIDYVRHYGNTIEIRKIIKNDFLEASVSVEAAVIDSATYLKLDTNKKKYNATKIDAGECLVVSSEQNKIMLEGKEVMDMLKVNNLDFAPLTTSDQESLEQLSSTLNKMQNTPEAIDLFLKFKLHE